MPDTDLDHELAQLRDEMRGSLPVPELSKIVARNKQRVVRRRMQLGAVVAVLVVSMAIPLLREQMTPEPVKPATPPAETSPLPKEPFITEVEFADDYHGYAIRMTCEDGKPERCREQLLATEDGTHWQRRPLPQPKASPSWAVGALVALGPDELTVEWSASRSPEESDVYRVHSVDGGRTWEQVTVPNLVTAAVEEIPDGGKLIPSCAKLAGGGTQCTERGVAVLMPGSGESALLANRPRLTAMAAGHVPTAGGQWWMVGRDPQTNQWGLAISDDDGRSWTTTVLDFRESVDQDGWSVASSGDTLYATAIGARANTSNGLVAIFRSTDGGRTWERTWRPVGEETPRRVHGHTVVADDGTLSINAPDGKAYVSRDGGRTFTETEPRYGDYVFWTETGYVAVDVVSGRDVDVSEDGVHWRKVKIG
jgi:photosystem II stability/assembly factor-like uncharacterized protein